MLILGKNVGYGRKVTLSLVKIVYSGPTLRAPVSLTLLAEMMAVKNNTLISRSGQVVMGLKGDLMRQSRTRFRSQEGGGTLCGG